MILDSGNDSIVVNENAVVSHITGKTVCFHCGLDSHKCIAEMECPSTITVSISTIKTVDIGAFQ